MSQPPLTFLEQKWNTGWNAGGGSNRLIQAATQGTDRQAIPMQDYDLHRNITPYGRRVLLSLGRYLAENVSQVRGVLKEKADLSSIGIISQYYGLSDEFKDLAENWVLEHNRICDTNGAPFTMETLRRNHEMALDRDGEFAIMFTEGDGGYPLLQCIGAHRIGSPEGYTIVQGGAFDGARIIDGVILSDYGRRIGYRVLLGDSGYVLGKYRDVPTSDLIVSFIPDYPEQVRGMSPIGKAAFDFMDVSETRAFEKSSLKLGSHYGMVVKNESGTVDRSKMVMRGGATAPDATTGAAQSLSSQVVNGVGVYYFKAGAGQGLEPVKNDRPSSNQQNFEAEIIRSALFGIGWSVDFSLDPTKAGGASMRIVVEKINRAISASRAMGLEPVCRRIDGWRVAKAIKLGLLPDVVDWWKWEYQWPAEITADKKYDSDVDIAEMRAGIRSPQKAIGKRGQYFEDTQDECIRFFCRGVRRTKEIAAEENVSGEVEWKDVQWDTPNGPSPEQPEEKEDPLVESEIIKRKLDIYGVGVRAGTYKPTPEDEDFFRNQAGLPKMSPAAQAAWVKDKNVRRPITLVGQDEITPAQPPAPIEN